MEANSGVREAASDSLVGRQSVEVQKYFSQFVICKLCATDIRSLSQLFFLFLATILSNDMGWFLHRSSPVTSTAMDFMLNSYTATVHPIAEI